MADSQTKIVISAEDKTAAAFASAKAGLEKFSAAYASLGSLAGVGVAAALAAGVKHVIDLGDEMHDLSQKVGISVQDLGTWRLAAEQSGASLESVAKGVKGLSQYMVQNSDKLREAGITATDANGALIQLADLFKALPDGVEKTALAVQLFGKSGMDMIPMLNLGSQGLDEARKKAEAYSKKLAELAPQADKFNDVLRELKLQSELTALSFTTRLIDPLTSVAEAMREARGGAEGLYSVMKRIGEITNAGPLSVFELIAAGANVAIPRSKGYSGPKNAAGLPMSDLEMFDQATAAYLADAPARAAAAEARKRAQGLLDKSGPGKAEKSIGSVQDYSMRVNEAVAGAINSSAVVKSRELADQIEALDKLFFEAGLEAEIYTSALAKLTGQTDRASKEQGRLAELLGATPTAKLEEARKDMELLAAALEAGHINEEQFIEATQARLGTLGHAVKEVDNFARDMGLSFQSAFEDAALSGKDLSDVIQGLGKDIERIILRKTVSEPLGNSVSDWIKSTPAGGSGGLLGGIKNLFGFASGGSFTVGGAGGTDSQLVAFKATPGEEVSVRTPGQQGGGGIVIQQHIYPAPGVSSADLLSAMVQAKNAAVAEIRNSSRRGMA